VATEKKIRPPAVSRPHMPGYGLPRSRRGLLRWAWAADRLRRSHNYWLITTRPEGPPHAMPVWGLWLDDRFYFSSGRDSRKSRNLAANPRCVVCNERAEAAVIVEGTARAVTDPAVLARLARPYQRKYRPWKLDPDMGPVYEVYPRVVFGVVERTFPDSTTRWVFPPARRKPSRRR
jgi:nitroimidazol reductase NimA-like FMN-containing flavoprotein (pyridoxamine 5'-phosphate oxidase superfamily)